MVFGTPTMIAAGTITTSLNVGSFSIYMFEKSYHWRIQQEI